MKQVRKFTLLTVGLLFLGVALAADDAVAQQKTLNNSSEPGRMFPSILSAPMATGCRSMVPIRRELRALIAMAAICC